MPVSTFYYIKHPLVSLNNICQLDCNDNIFTKDRARIDGQTDVINCFQL